MNILDMHSIIQWPFRKKIVNGILLFVFLVFLFEDVLLTINASRITPIIGLRMNGLRVAGLTDERIASFVRNMHEDAPIRFTYENQSIDVFPQEVGAAFNLRSALPALHRYGRDGSLLKRLVDQNKAFFGFANIRTDGIISRPLLTAKIMEINSIVNRLALPAQPDFKNDITKTIPAHAGVKVDVDTLAALIEKNIFRPPQKTVSIPVFATAPGTLTPQELSSLRDEAIRLTSKPILITSAGRTFALTSKELRSLITIIERPDPKKPKTITHLLRLNENDLNHVLGNFAKIVEDTTQSEFNDHDARVAIYAQFYSGKRRVIDIPTQIRNESEIVAFNNEQSPPSTVQSLPYFASVKEAFAAIDTPQATTTSKFVYLTFDDGPNAVYHPLILDILKKYDIQATFFLVGENAKKFPEITDRTVAEGHKIGNHSLTHAFLPRLPIKKIAKEIQATTDILQSFYGKQLLGLFRPPYGGVNSAVKTNARSRKLKLILWSVDPRDWSEPATDELVERVVSHVHNGSNILLHSNHLATVKALPKIIERLESEGFAFKIL